MSEKTGIRLTPQAFAERWVRAKLTKRAAVQSHFIDLCRMLGEQTPAEAAALRIRRRAA